MNTKLQNKKIRNIAIIAHVDHGKTTFVDAMFRQSGIFRKNQEINDRIMDNMDLEREKGITISAKNCSINHNGIKINIIDTPGHADFGGEVERALSMVEGAILLVDASEGPLPQTRFVLQKALEADIKLVTIINKIDRKDSQTNKVLDEIYDLFIDLGATEEQIDNPILYAIGRNGMIGLSPEKCNYGFELLFETIINKIPPPKYKPDTPFQMRVSDLGYSEYLGKLAIGKIVNGSAKIQDKLISINANGKKTSFKVSQFQSYVGTNMIQTQKITAGEIAILSGVNNVAIGDTICNATNISKALPKINVDPPTVSMLFTVNDSPISGKEGKYIQSSKINERLKKESLLNVGIQITNQKNKESIIAKGRGELQMAILIETMRREGYEFCVGRPKVILKYKNGITLEPIERLFIDCEENFVGIVTKKLSKRKSKMISLTNNQKGRSKIEFSAPSRALIGYRDEFLTDTKGTGIMNSYFDKWSNHRGDFETRTNGSIISDREGIAVAYALFNLEARGKFFIKPGDYVYKGMIVGKRNKNTDIHVNPTKEKKLTNMRASGKDDSIQLTPVKSLSVEKAISFIREDELVEITPKSIRMKKINSCKRN